MKNTWIGILVFLAPACGKPVVVSPVENTTAAHPEVSHPASEPLAAAAVDAACPLFFPKAGLCGGVEWKTSPSADAPSDLVLRFWKFGAGTREAGPYVTPSVQPKAFFIMKCCKTPKGCPLKAGEAGVYSASGITLMSGEYWHYVQLGSEKASLDVVVP